MRTRGMKCASLPNEAYHNPGEKLIRTRERLAYNCCEMLESGENKVGVGALALLGRLFEEHRRLGLVGGRQKGPRICGLPLLLRNQQREGVRVHRGRGSEVVRGNVASYG